MFPVEAIHARYVYPGRIASLAAMLGLHLPFGARVLDVGCGDGLLARTILRARPDLQFVGAEPRPRRACHIRYTCADGARLPHQDGAFDAVLLVDVLHHTPRPGEIIAEAVRVASGPVVIKDHTRDSALAGWILRFMDIAGNARFSVSLPYNYWSSSQWREEFARQGVEVAVWEKELPLYPRWAAWLFSHNLHCLVVLRPRTENLQPAASLVPEPR